MSCECCGPVDRVHLVFQRLSGYIDEEPWDTVPCAAPNDIGSLIVVPCGGLGDHTRGLGGLAEVGTDVVEFLSLSIESGCLG